MMLNVNNCAPYIKNDRDPNLQNFENEMYIKNAPFEKSPKEKFSWYNK